MTVRSCDGGRIEEYMQEEREANAQEVEILIQRFCPVQDRIVDFATIDQQSDNTEYICRVPSDVIRNKVFLNSQNQDSSHPSEFQL